MKTLLVVVVVAGIMPSVYTTGDIQERTANALFELNKTFPEWSENYEYGEWDCSEMSTFVQMYLARCGVRAEYITGIKQGRYHCWIEVDTGQEILAIEATNLWFADYDYYHDIFKVVDNPFGLKDRDFWNSRCVRMWINDKH